MASLLEIFIPSECIICGRIESRVCERCEPLLASDPRLVIRQGLYGFAAGDYSPQVRAILRSFKELGESSLARKLARPMASLVDCFHASDITITAIPGNRKTTLDRGFNQAELLAREILRMNPSLRFRRLLRKTRDTLDQSKLKPGERLINQQNAMVAEVGRLNVVVVDDIITTGATMRAAADALQHAGHHFVGFVTFAETESKKV